MFDFRQIFLFLIALTLVPIGCSEGTDSTQPPSEKPAKPTAEEQKKLQNEADIGETNERKGPPGKSDDFYHYGQEDHSEQCKPIPDLEPLSDPKVVISLNGLSLHLWDREGDYDKVFKIGVGSVGSDGHSATPVSTDRPSEKFYLRADKRAIEDSRNSEYRRWAWNYSCRIWSGKKYHNPATDRAEYRSYFAGLPFVRFEGTQRAVYGIHGPITNYWQEDGGDLRRGYVSGGCVRMKSEAIREFFARIRGHKTPARIQRKVETRPDGLPVSPDRFINAACREDADCAGDDTICAKNPLSGDKFCTKTCQTSSECPTRDKDEVHGTPSRKSVCVSNPTSGIEAEGLCLTESNQTANKHCARFGNRFRRSSLPRLDEPTDSVQVCAPTGDKWFGQTCSDDAECSTGHCVTSEDGPGFCSRPCEGVCPDREGQPLSRCVKSIDADSGGNCVPTCQSEEDCLDSQTCVTREFSGRTGSDKVCIPTQQD